MFKRLCSMTIVLRFFPNGEFTQGVDTSNKRKEKHHQKKSLSTVSATVSERHTYLTNFSLDDAENQINYYTPGRQFENRSEGIYTYLCEDSKGHHFAYESETYVLADVVINEPIGALIARGEMTPLVHQMVESSPLPEKPSRKTLEAMTSNMARNIRNGVYLLEQMYGKDNLSFLTLTLPNLSKDDLSKVCDNWDNMTDQILKSLRKRAEKHRMELEYVYCTEIQTKRLEKRNEYAPHLHIVFRGRHGRKTSWFTTPKQVRKSWASIIANVLGHNQFRRDALENLQRIRKSAARYLSKYLSKGKCCNAKADSGENQVKLRTQWGGMARRLSRQIKKCTTRLSSANDNGGLAVYITSTMDDLLKHGFIKYYRYGYIPLHSCEISGVERVIKVCTGCLSAPSYEGGLIPIYEAFYEQQSLL